MNSLVIYHRSFIFPWKVGSILCFSYSYANVLTAFWFLTCAYLRKWGWTFCLLLVTFYSLLVARYFLLVAHYFLLVARCSLLFTCCSLLFSRCSSLITFCSLLVTLCSLLSTRCSLIFCSLLITFWSLLFARCPLLFARLLVAYCEIKSLWTAQKWFSYYESPPKIFTLQTSEIFVTFSGWWFSKFSQHAKPFSKLA